MGINHDHRDELFINLIYSCKNEIERKGIELDIEQVDDLVLLCDYALWQYQKRHDDVPLPQNLKLRISNRQMRGRANYES